MRRKSRWMAWIIEESACQTGPLPWTRGHRQARGDRPRRAIGLQARKGSHRP